MSSLCVNELKENLDYNPDTGLFVRRIAKSNHPKAQVGQVAGWKTKNGYINISIGNKNYSAHRLAWLYVRGELPDTGVDHKDLDKTNNRISNLRLADKSQNACNTNLIDRNTSGTKGVSWHKASKKWRAFVSVDRKVKHLGLFENKQEAIFIRREAEKKYYGDFARSSNEGLT